MLFGGTFDPPHIGHLVMAELALEQTGADEVWFVPAAAPPHKPQPERDFTWRVEMLRALIVGRSHFQISTIEQELPLPSYTVDTVAAIKRRYPGEHFCFLIGADSLASLPTWQGAPQLVRQIPFLVAPRSGYDISEVYRRVAQSLPGLLLKTLDMPIIDVSSTWLRQRLLAGKSACGLMPDRVLEIWNQAPDSVHKPDRKKAGSVSGGEKRHE
ncbi:nicotinate (nicotinamide) nucleotide adenylyltransferase [Alicyclobacillus herbarius]|uniref:nicotinate (nicotinamide) nucleotide adenylyltransferase n=1 Tax=Alicyclobacillus herbarius TaxID=122960 RepID=UPI002480915C|nr:nicotinate (nicotinamide) nucleotide adenylyltransferase [Alicyclobacillus herbarius]